VTVSQHYFTMMREPDAPHGDFHFKEVRVPLGNRVENI
jgi:hypothetical protein